MSDFQSYAHKRARVSARKLSPTPGQLDALGVDCDDYYAAFTLKLLEQRHKMKATKPTALDERRWIDRVLRNELIDKHRRRIERYKRVQRFQREQSVGFYGATPEEEVIRKQLLNKLRDKLSKIQWDLLMKFVECGSAKQMWLDSREQCLEETYYKRVDRLLHYCRDVIQNFT